jgi:membrane protein implicated in regulation of membrane protease activity
METVFLVCAAVGGTLLLCQLLLALLGLGPHDVDHEHDFGHDHEQDVDHDHAASWYVGILTFRGVTSALTFFGLGGLAASEASLEFPLPLAIAVASGLGVLVLIAWIMKNLQRLKADGTVRIDRAIGKTGTVYLSVPGNQTGAGKVTVKLQNRTVEYLAVTRQEPLAPGTPIQVVAVVSPNTVEVIPVPQAQRITHV